MWLDTKKETGAGLQASIQYFFFALHVLYLNLETRQKMYCTHTVWFLDRFLISHCHIFFLSWAVKFFPERLPTLIGDLLLREKSPPLISRRHGQNPPLRFSADWDPSPQQSFIGLLSRSKIGRKGPFSTRASRSMSLKVVVVVGGGGFWEKKSNLPIL